MSSVNEKTMRIRDLNDTFRRTLTGGRLLITVGVSAMGPAHVAALLDKLREFEQFDEANDPYGEHDFGALDHDDKTFLWKIDYYAPSLDSASADPTDPLQTVRVLTLMLAQEY